VTTNNYALAQASFARAQQNVFNVKDYGALGDGSLGTPATNDCTAIQAAIYAAGLAGGGTVFFPDGIYNISTNPFTYTGAYGPWPAQNSSGGQMLTQLHFPTLNLYTNSPICIILKGAHQIAPQTSWGGGGVNGASNSINGAIILSQRTDGNVGNTAVIGTGFSTNDYGAWQENGMYIVLDSIIVRTKPGANYNAVNLVYFGMASVYNCLIDTGSAVNLLTVPTTFNYGLRMPYVNNWVISEVRNTDIIGYFNGLNVNEHIDGDNIRIWCCINGLVVGTAYHTMTINHLLCVGCTTNIYADAAFKAPLTIANFSTEHTTLTGGQAWETCLADLFDPNSYLHGDMKYATIVSSVGMTNDWKQVGGTNFDCMSLNNNGHQFVKSALFSGPLQGNATTATAATNDSAGNAINAFYLPLNGNGSGLTSLNGDSLIGSVLNTTNGTITTRGFTSSTNGIVLVSTNLQSSSLSLMSWGASYYPVPAFTPKTLGQSGILDVLSSDQTSEAWIDTGTSYNGNGEYLTVGLRPGLYGFIAEKGLGSKPGKPLILQPPRGAGYGNIVPIVGINTTNPAATLDVNGNTSITGNITNVGGVFVGNGGGLTNLAIVTTYNAPVAVTVGASPFLFTNTTSTDMRCFISGGAATVSVGLNATTVADSLAALDYSLIIGPTEYITLTYSIGTPTLYTNKFGR
jgi:hypothetical protein